MIEDEIVRWHHQVNEHEFELALEVGDGQGSLACCSPRGCKESDRTDRLNWLYIYSYQIVIYIWKWSESVSNSFVLTLAHGIFQARILEWVAIPFSRGFPQPKDWTRVSCIAGKFFYYLIHWRSLYIYTQISPGNNFRKIQEREGKKS